MYFVLNILNILKQEAQKCVDLVNNQNNHELEQPESMNAFQIWCDRLKDLRSNAPQSLFFKIEAETIDQVLEEIVELCASCDSQDQIEKAVREYILASRREFPRENIAPLDLIANRNFEGVKRIVRSRVYFILATHPSFKNNL
jgi:hypothetical protein